MNLNLTAGAKIDVGLAPVAAGTTSQVTSTFDCSGIETITCILSLGTITSGAACSLKAQGGAASDGSDKTDLAGTKITVLDTEDNTLVILEIVKPTYQYITFAVTLATQNTVINNAIIIRTQAHRQPVTQGATVSHTKLVCSPIAGTA